MRLNRKLFLLVCFFPSLALSELTKFNEVMVLGSFSRIEKNIQDEIIKRLQFVYGEYYTNDDILSVKNDIENILLKRYGDRYSVFLIENDPNKGKVVYFLSEKSFIEYKGIDGYLDQNIEASLPSLKENKFHEDGRQWFDQRELNMAQENPLKVTLMHYDLEPETKSSTLTVYSHAPYGKRYNYIAVDNYGSRHLNYGRFSLGHINANLSGNDDVLTFNALSSFKRPEDSYAFNLSYLYPFYKQHQTLGMNVSYSHTDSDEKNGLLNGLDRKTAQGNLLQIGLNWNYYLPTLDIGIKDQLKFNAGYLYRYYDQRSRIEANQGALALDNNFRVGLAGVNIGLSGEIKPTLSSTVLFNVNQAYYSDQIPGSNKTDDLSKFGYERNYNLTSYSLSYSQDIKNWNIKTSLEGQYSANKIPSLDYHSIASVYSVRGFRYSGLSSDKSIIWRSEITTPEYSNLNLKNYIFYDWGKFSYNDSNRQDGIVSSVGLGLKLTPVKGLNFDFFVARRLHNAKLDSLDNGKMSDKASFWGKMSFGF